MSYIYLVRHGRPITPNAESHCFGGNSNPSLCEEGREQAEALIHCFDGLPVSCIHSGTLKRGIETAEIVSDGRWEIRPTEGLNEINVGEWEGLNFREIRARYPNLYAERGLDWSICPPNGECMEHAADRMEKALKTIADTEECDVLAVTHEGLMRALLWRLMRMDAAKDAMPRFPYGSITALKYERGAMHVAFIGRLPESVPSEEEIFELWEQCATPETVRMHCRAVCEEALRIRQQLADAGISVSGTLLRAEALLHDLCRKDGHGHAANAASLLRERGYLNVAYAIERHHGGALRDGMDDAQVLFLADKRMDGVQRVTVRERFEKSRTKCTTQEALKHHDARFMEALGIENKIDDIIRKKDEEKNETD